MHHAPNFSFHTNLITIWCLFGVYDSRERERLFGNDGT